MWQRNPKKISLFWGGGFRWPVSWITSVKKRDRSAPGRRYKPVSEILQSHPSAMLSSGLALSETQAWSLMVGWMILSRGTRASSVVVTGRQNVECSAWNRYSRGQEAKCSGNHPQDYKKRSGLWRSLTCLSSILSLLQLWEYLRFRRGWLAPGHRTNTTVDRALSAPFPATPITLATFNDLLKSHDWFRTTGMVETSVPNAILFL